VPGKTTRAFDEKKRVKRQVNNQNGSGGVVLRAKGEMR